MRHPGWSAGSPPQTPENIVSRALHTGLCCSTICRGWTRRRFLAGMGLGHRGLGVAGAEKVDADAGAGSAAVLWRLRLGGQPDHSPPSAPLGQLSVGLTPAKDSADVRRRRVRTGHHASWLPWQHTTSARSSSRRERPEERSHPPRLDRHHELGNTPGPPDLARLDYHQCTDSWREPRRSSSRPTEHGPGCSGLLRHCRLNAADRGREPADHRAVERPVERERSEQPRRPRHVPAPGAHPDRSSSCTTPGRATGFDDRPLDAIITGLKGWV